MYHGQLEGVSIDFRSAVLPTARLPRTQLLDTDMQTLRENLASTILSTTTEEVFAEHMMEELENYDLPPGQTCYSLFQEIWKGEVLHKMGLDNIIPDIESGVIANEAELTARFTAVLKDEKYRDTPQNRRDEARLLLTDELKEHKKEQEKLFNEYAEDFKKADSVDTAKTSYTEKLENPKMRCVLEEKKTLEGEEIYKAYGSDKKPNKAVIKKYVEAMYKKWAEAEVTAMK